MNNKSTYWTVVLVILLSSLIFILGTGRKSLGDEPMTVYEVYLDGNSIGIIEDEEELYSLIDKEQENLKKKFGVDKIYAPIGLETTKLLTYTGEVERASVVYERLKDKAKFTLKGYEITISYDENNSTKINVLKKEDFDEAIDNTIKAFVDEKQYEEYLEGKQSPIKTTGSLIENVKIKEDIAIKEKRINAEDEIFTDVTKLSQYLLFGTTDSQGTHIVTGGETIKDIASKYELSIKEFLIVNPNIVGENALLFAGQTVNIGLINPKVSVVVENTLIEDKEVAYKREVKYDKKLMVGTTYTEQKGQDGLSRVEYYTETINGQITQVVQMSSNVITPVVNEVVVKGGLSSNYLGDTGAWAWPTNPGYIIVATFGYRWDPVYKNPDGSPKREYHRGIDICGTGFGSPIYAANSGTVIKATHHYEMGNVIYIDHGKGYVTVYMHMTKFASNIKVGYAVEKGEQIGYMGSTGKSIGTHLDFRVKYNDEYIDPLILNYK